MTDFIVVIVILVIVGSAIYYIRKQKDKGIQCIGCPDAKNCKKQNCASCKQPSINLNLKVK